MKVAIPFAVTNSINPNFNTSAYSSQVDIYYKCSFVAFSTIRRWNPTLKLEFVSNVNPPSEFLDQIASLEVNFKHLPFTFLPPGNRIKLFRASFYLLDAIVGEADTTLFLDPDVVCIGSLFDTFQSVQDDQVGVFELHTDMNRYVNGMTPGNAIKLYNKLTKSNFSFRSHLGGESILITSQIQPFISNSIRELWLELESLSADSSIFTTEEHFLGAVLSPNKLLNLNPYISRIWTAHAYRSIEGGDSNLANKVLWHLPSEKERGFVQLWHQISRDDNFLTSLDEHEFKKCLMKIFSIEVSIFQILRSKVFRPFKGLINFYRHLILIGRG